MQKFKVFEILKESFEVLKKNIWFLVSSTFIYYVMYILLTKSGRGMSSIILNVAAFVTSTVFSIGMYKIGLLVLSGGVPKTDDFKPESVVFFRFIWMSVIVGFIVFVGFIFLIIPGVYIMVRLSMSTFVLTNKKLNAVDSIKESWRITKGSTLKLFGLMLMVCIIFIISSIPLGLGLLISTPYYYIVWANAYKKLDSEDITVTPVSA